MADAMLPGDSDTPLRLYTIGHSSLPAETFLGHLRRYGVSTLVDIRSDPVSKVAPHFNKAALETLLPTTQITYRFAGKYLGGRPADPALYRGGEPDYPRMMQTETYVTGIMHLLNLIALEQKTGYLAIMCSEADPRRCHRHHLVARSLLDRRVGVLVGSINLSIQHILPDGTLEVPLAAGDFLNLGA